jgi:hypothetical protein
VSYELGTVKAEWGETYDLAQRLIRKRSWLGPNTEFSWLGDLYLGRDQDQPGRQSPFRERRTLDHFGSPIGWRFTALDVDTNGQPSNTLDGAAYCGTTWNVTECGRPLLAIETRGQSGK